MQQTTNCVTVMQTLQESSLSHSILWQRMTSTKQQK